MEHRFSPANSGSKTDGDTRAPKNILGKILLLSLTSVLAFFFLSIKDVFLFITSYAIAVGMLAFFVKEKVYGALVIPVIASFACLPHFTVLAVTLFFMLLLAFLCASYLNDRPGQFAFFTMCALMYSLAAVGAGVYVAVQYFGSVEACLEELTVYLTGTAEKLFSNIPEDLKSKITAEDLSVIKSRYLEAVKQTVYLIPSFLVVSAMYAALLTKSSVTKALGGKKMLPVLFSTPYYPPVLLALGYMILSLVGIFFAVGSTQSYFIYANMVSVLGVIFAAVGVVEYFGVLKSPVHPRQRVVYIVMGLVVVGLVSEALLSVLAYYGAYRTIFSRVKVIRITKK